MEAAVTTDFQFNKIIQMILDGCDDLEEVKEKIRLLLSNQQKPSAETRGGDRP